MRVLVTGGTGFVGKAICSDLRANGHDVVCLSRSAAETDSGSQRVFASLGSDGCVDRVLSNVDRCDAIVHAAACIDHSLDNPELVKTNCLGTQQLISVAANWKVRSVVYISGSAVIGEPNDSPISESHTTHPRTVYHASKLFGEHITLLLASEQTASTSLRVSAPIGPGMPPNRMLSVFIRNALEGRPLTLWGKGTRRQNYVDVRDVAHAVQACLLHRPRGVFNVGGATAVSNRELAETCIRVLGSRSPVQFADKPDPADGQSWDMSIQAAGDAFAYRPQYDLESSIEAIARDHADRAR